MGSRKAEATVAHARAQSRRQFKFMVDWTGREGECLKRYEEMDGWMDGWMLNVLGRRRSCLNTRCGMPSAVGDFRPIGKISNNTEAEKHKIVEPNSNNPVSRSCGAGAYFLSVAAPIRLSAYAYG